MIDNGEECDDGNSVNGDGCDTTCQFSCVSTDSARDCGDAEECHSANTCDDATHKCVAGPAMPDGSTCGGGSCAGGLCKPVTCGDGKVQGSEECDGGAGCKADCTFECDDSPATQCAAGGPAPACSKYACTTSHTCETVADAGQNGMSCDATSAGKVCSAGACILPVCGNGVREPGEDCDDGATLNLDGCDSDCRLEQAARITSLQQQFATDDFCPANALGVSITGEAQSTIQATWDLPVGDGRISLVFKFLGVTEPLGPMSSATFDLGFVNASPGAAPAGVTYDGTHDLDWWYVRESGSVDANEVPLVKLPGQLANGRITAGPGELSLKLLFAFQPAQIHLFNSKVDAMIESSVLAPTMSSGTSPGHLASENLDPAITTFTKSSQGAMCADVSVKSLSDTPIPELLQVGCDTEDGQSTVFTPGVNSLLDVFIVGCNLFGTGQGITPTQPDGSIDGAMYHFNVDPTTLAVTSCTRDGMPDTLAHCVEQATYSSYFKFEAGRVIIHRDGPLLPPPGEM